MSGISSTSIAKTQGIGSDFKYTFGTDGTTLTSQITFNENTLISQFIGAVQANGLTVSNYAWSALAPLKFNLGSLLGTQYAKTGLPTPILTRLVIFTVGNFNIMNAYDNGTTIFADDNIQVFKYITPTITILPYSSLTASDSTSSSNGNN